MTASLPHQAAPPDESRPPEDRRHVIRRRALTLLIIVLLIGVPAGYLVISANQSRDSGKDKEAKYSATGLTKGWPSKIQRRLYQVPIPHPRTRSPTTRRTTGRPAVSTPSSRPRRRDSTSSSRTSA